MNSHWLDLKLEHWETTSLVGTEMVEAVCYILLQNLSCRDNEYDYTITIGVDESQTGCIP